MKRSLILLLFGIVFISACVAGASPEDIAKATGFAKEFLAQYPNAQITAVFIDSTDVDLASLQKQCGSQMKQIDYYKVTIADPSSDLNVVVWIDASNNKVLCAIKSAAVNPAVTPIVSNESQQPTNQTIAQPTVIYPYLFNGDFSYGLDGWEKWHSSNVDDEWKIEVEPTDNPYTNVLNFERSHSSNDGGVVTVLQRLNFDVSGYEQLYLKADVKVVSNTLQGSGWWSDVYNQAGEYPVHLFVYYNDSNNQQHLWSWGFLTEQNVNKKTNYNVVKAGEWYSFTSQNLMELDPKPKIVTIVRVGGNGWDFHGKVDNVQLIAQNVTPPNVTTKPVVYVYHSPLYPTVNQSVTLYATATDDVNVTQMDMVLDGEIVKTCYPNTRSGNCSYTRTFSTTGNHTYYAQALDNSGNYGRDPTSGTKTFTVLPPPTLVSGPDLEANKLDFSVYVSPATGPHYDIYLRLKNIGIATAYNVSYKWTDIVMNKTLFSGTYNKISPGEQLTFGANWLDVTDGNHVIEGFVDYTNTIFESNENNNKIVNTLAKGTANATTPVLYYGFGYTYNLYAVHGADNSYATIVIKNALGNSVENLTISKGDTRTTTSIQIPIPLKIALTGVRALQDGTVVGADLAAWATDCTAGTADASTPVKYSGYSVYATQGVANSWAKIVIKDSAGNVVDTLIIEDKTQSKSTLTGLTITILNVKALSDLTVVGVDLRVCKE